jgi:hypothetical protein
MVLVRACNTQTRLVRVTSNFNFVTSTECTCLPTVSKWVRLCIRSTMSHMRRSSAASNQSASSLDEFFDANEVERGNSFFASAADASSSEDEQQQQPQEAATDAYASLPGVPARQRELPPVPARPTAAATVQATPSAEPDVELRKLQIVDKDTGRVVNIDDAANAFQGYSMLPPAQAEEAPPSTSPSKPKRWGFRHSRGGGSSAAAAAAAAAEGAVKVESSSKELK